MNKNNKRKHRINKDEDLFGNKLEDIYDYSLYEDEKLIKNKRKYNINNKYILDKNEAQYFENEDIIFKGQRNPIAIRKKSINVKTIAKILVIIFGVFILVYLIKGVINEIKYVEELADKNDSDLHLVLTEDEKNKNNLDDRVEKILSDLTIEEKIAQLFIAEVKTSVMSEVEASKFQTPPAGYIYLSSNFKNTEQIKKLLQDTEKIPSKLPYFMSVDNEGGLVYRTANLTDCNKNPMPSMYSLGQKDDEEYTRSVAKRIAEETLELGFNLNYAPVLDIYSPNGVLSTRSISSDKEKIVKHAKIIIEEFEKSKLLYSLKHFPGHGMTVIDSHTALPVVKKEKQLLIDEDIYPFAQIIKSNKIPMVMLTHTAYKAFDNETTPAIFSENIVKYLRENLEYDGIIITDALNMGAVDSKYTESEKCLNALNAGVDILLMPNNLKQSIQDIKTFINDGKITEERINESVKRIIKLKIQYFETDFNDNNNENNNQNNEENNEENTKENIDYHIDESDSNDSNNININNNQNTNNFEEENINSNESQQGNTNTNSNTNLSTRNSSSTINITSERESEDVDVNTSENNGNNSNENSSGGNYFSNINLNNN